MDVYVKYNTEFRMAVCTICRLGLPSTYVLRLTRICARLACQSLPAVLVRGPGCRISVGSSGWPALLTVLDSHLDWRSGLAIAAGRPGWPSGLVGGPDQLSRLAILVGHLE